LKKILIAGGTGFIGYHLAKYCLNKNWMVVSFSKNLPKKIRKIKKVKYIKGDLYKKNDLKKIKGKFDYVVNLGGYVDHVNKVKTYNSHYLGCKNLSNYFLNKDIKSFIQMGSSGEYGKIKAPHKEFQVCKPKSVYSNAKFLSSLFLLKLYKKYNFPFTVLRLYQAYGEKQDINRLIPIVITSCINDHSFPCSDGKQYRDFVHVNDVILAIIKSILNKNSRGQIFNLGSGRPIKIKKLILLIRKKIGKGKPLFGKIKLRSEEAVKVYPEIKKIKKMINWSPKIKFELGLNKTIKYYKNILKLKN
jgi:nucleoside-diphosphate-sugar epimerase